MIIKLPKINLDMTNQLQLGFDFGKKLQIKHLHILISYNIYIEVDLHTHT